jgi:hypothetical protein
MSRLPDTLIKQKYPFAELARCAEREVNMRRHVYPNRVLTSRMSQQTADREIRMMEESAALLAHAAGSERLL